ncbi:uncharacterized protein BX663DRAFT_500345 [Cokeromyces recurvatus]|uniref:uncharacterized protein n=1 Tax=Cokeromyces recurvatus TaxID=90255 RepID=UPI00222095E5|nr:uncharacterized protein BX663DRAFT_500345 [Cokeromyces recurvatus]KAI7905613.1 hypothetical protein BX663DRAFT_500345 [Cokeromyces recurvatus]
MILLNYGLLLSLLFYVQIQNINAFLSVINCSWPCPNADDKCVITANNAACRYPSKNSWIMNATNESPIYTGASVSHPYLPCIPAPIPQLPLVTYNSTVLTQGQTIIDWPTSSLYRPLDNYLGNCDHQRLYCSSFGQDIKNPICRPRLKVGLSCASSNQCLSSYCYNYICSPRDKSNSSETDNDSSPQNLGEWSDDDDPSKSTKTIQIFASIFGIIGGLAFIIVGIIIYSRHKKRKKHKKTTDNKVHQSSLPVNELITTESQQKNKEEQFEFDFLSKEPTIIDLSSSSNSSRGNNNATIMTTDYIKKKLQKECSQPIDRS